MAATSSSETRKCCSVDSPAAEASLVTVDDWESSGSSLARRPDVARSVAAAIVVVVVVVVIEASWSCDPSPSTEAAIFAAMDRVVTGPGLGSISPDSRRNRQVTDLR